MNMPRLTIVVIILSLATASAQNQRTNEPIRVFRYRVAPHWFAKSGGETNLFWYRLNLPKEESEFILVDAGKGTRTPAFDHERMAKALTEKLNRTIEPRKLPFEAIGFSKNGSSLRLISTN